jgi:hypothetical protein
MTLLESINKLEQRETSYSKSLGSLSPNELLEAQAYYVALYANYSELFGELYATKEMTENAREYNYHLRLVHYMDENGEDMSKAKAEPKAKADVQEYKENEINAAIEFQRCRMKMTSIEKTIDYLRQKISSVNRELSLPGNQHVG